MTLKTKMAIRVYAGLLSTMQQTRQELLRLGCGKDRIDHGALYLGQLIEQMENATKEKFIRFTGTGEII